MTTNKLVAKRPNFAHNFNQLSRDWLFYGVASVAVMAIIIMLAANPKAYSNTTLQGLNLFVTAVLPGLLPFMFLTRVLTSLGVVKKVSTHCGKLTQALFGTSGVSGYVMVMSMLSGYPIGAKLIADLHGACSISTPEAKRMISFCTTSGPIFIIGSVGSIMFGSPVIGVVLYISHILGSIMSGITLKMLGKMWSLWHLPTKCKHKNKADKNSDNIHNQIFISQTPQPHPDRLDKIIADSMADTVSSILVVGAYIAIFFLLAQMLVDIGLLSGLAKLLDYILTPLGITGAGSGVAGGLLEVTRGCNLLASNTGIGSVCLACGVISFSGLSIIMQSMNFLHKTGVKTGYFVAIKFFNAILSALICWPICLMFGIG